MTARHEVPGSELRHTARHSRLLWLFRAAVAVALATLTSPAGALVECSYVGDGCNSGYSATATFTCLSSTRLQIEITNTSTVNDSVTSHNILDTISFPGPEPQNPAVNNTNSALIAPGSTALSFPPAYSNSSGDCSGVLNGSDVSCEWGAGPDYCGCGGEDDACPSPIDQCTSSLSFVTSRQSTTINCDADNFVLQAGSIDSASDGPDYGLINSPTQNNGGNEAIDDTAIVEVDVNNCVENTTLCEGCTTFGSHFRHACHVTTTTTTTTEPPTTTTSATFGSTTTTEASTTTTSEPPTTTTSEPPTTTTSEPPTTTTREPPTTTTSAPPPTTTTTAPPPTTTTTAPPPTTTTTLPPPHCQNSL